jgi:hypothetical protein
VPDFPKRGSLAGCVHIWNRMELTLVQDFAIPARVASVIGATLFDRVFHRRFAETDGPLLYVYSRDQQSATEIDDDFTPSLNCEGEHPLAVGRDCEVECDSGSIVSLPSAHCCCGSQGCSNNV